MPGHMLVFGTQTTEHSPTTHAHIPIFFTPSALFFDRVLITIKNVMYFTQFFLFYFVTIHIFLHMHTQIFVVFLALGKVPYP